MSVPNELADSVSKLVDLSKQLSEAKSDIKNPQPGREATQRVCEEAHDFSGY